MSQQPRQHRAHRQRQRRDRWRRDQRRSPAQPAAAVMLWAVATTAVLVGCSGLAVRADDQAGSVASPSTVGSVQSESVSDGSASGTAAPPTTEASTTTARPPEPRSLTIEVHPPEASVELNTADGFSAEGRGPDPITAEIPAEIVEARPGRPTATRTIRLDHQIDYVLFDRPHRLPDADGERLFVTGFDSGELEVIDLASGESRVLLQTGGSMRHLVGSADGSVAYASAHDHGYGLRRRRRNR